jgi:glyoxylase-like metal-dependent hydrolase (beta-lactamase superfamily II)
MEQLIKLTENVYYTLPGDNDRPVQGIIIENNKTLIVDAGNSPNHAKNLLRHLNRFGIEKPTWLALTHWHWDHIFGSSTINTSTFAHIRTTQKILEMSLQKWDNKSLDERVNQQEEIPFCRDNIKLELPIRDKLRFSIPDISFEKQIKLNLDSKLACQVIHVGGNHSDDASVIYIPTEKVMFIGDCLFMNIYADIPYYTSAKLLSVLDSILKFDTEFFIESHSEEPIPSSDILKFASIVEDVSKSVLPINDKLLRRYFSKTSKNKYVNNILECWDFFLSYT